MLEAMPAWSGHDLHHHDLGLGSPRSPQHCRVQAAFPKPQLRYDVDQARLRNDSARAQHDVDMRDADPVADAATQTQAPSEQLSDSADSDATAADDRQSQAEPLLQDDENRFTMYPIKYASGSSCQAAVQHPDPERSQ